MPWLADRPVSFACTGFLAPNCTLFGRIDCVRVMVAWPEGPGRSRTVIYHLFPEAFFDRPGFAETLAVYRDYQIQVLEEDRSMIESMQLAMTSPAYRPSRMSTLEKPLHHYLNGYLDRVLGERPSGLALTGIALALPAIVGVSVSPAGAEHRPAAAGRHAQGVIWSLVAGACFAVLFIGLNRAGSGGGLWPVAAAQGAALVGVSCIGAVTRDLHLPAAGARWLAVLTGVSGGAGTVLYFLATQAGLLAVTAVLTSLYPAVTIVLARLLLGERLTAVRLAGLCLAAASVGLIAVCSHGANNACAPAKFFSTTRFASVSHNASHFCSTRMAPALS
jgi:uncharacterized membrane protein